MVSIIENHFNDEDAPPGAHLPLSIYPPWLNDYQLDYFNKLPSKLSNNISYKSINGIPITINPFQYLDNDINNNQINEYNQLLINDLSCNNLEINNDFNLKINKLKDKLNKAINTINENVNYDSNKKTNLIKTMTTKTNNKIKNIDKIIVCRKFRLSFNSQQKLILNNWFNKSDELFNYCVFINNECYKDKIYFPTDIKNARQLIFDSFYGNESKPIPYDILDDVINCFCSNLKSCISNIQNKHINHFEIKEKHNTKYKSILIRKKLIDNNGFYNRFLGKIKGFNKVNIDNINSDCRLTYDSILDKYYFIIPQYIQPKLINNRKPIVSLDPGEKHFMTYYSLSESGNIGSNMRIELLNRRNKISLYQRILKRNKNNKNKSIKHKKKINKKIQRQYTKIKNKVKELHNQTALYLVKNYDRILLPNFQTQNMVNSKNERNKSVKKRIKEIKDNQLLSEQEKKIEYRKYTKKCKLNKKIKFCLNQLSHYKFKQHISLKAMEYGCQLINVTEEYTSQCCGRCTKLSTTYNYREKKCIYCNYRIDRDVNGSRNILIKNIDKLIKNESGSNAMDG